MGLCLGSEWLEMVECYCYLGVLVTSKLSWADHIEQISAKTRKLVGMLHRKYSDTETPRCIYLTCIQPHLEDACQLWDPYTHKATEILESVQKFACKVFLKQWNMLYDDMLKTLNIPSLSIRRKYLKLITMFNIVNGYFYFPSVFFVQNHNDSNLCNQHVCRYVRPFARTNYLYSSYVPSAIADWNNLPSIVVMSSSISSFKYSLLCHFSEAHVSH